jgi:hypothetical protein
MLQVFRLFQLVCAYAGGTMSGGIRTCSDPRNNANETWYRRNQVEGKWVQEVNASAILYGWEETHTIKLLNRAIARPTTNFQIGLVGLHPVDPRTTPAQQTLTFSP